MQSQNQNTSDNGQNIKQEQTGGRVAPRKLLSGGQGKGKFGLGAQKLTGNIPNRPPPSSLNKQILANIKKPPAPLPAISPNTKDTTDNIQKELEFETTTFQKKDSEKKDVSLSVQEVSVESETTKKEQKQEIIQKKEVDFQFNKSGPDFMSDKNTDKQVVQEKDDEDEEQIEKESVQKKFLEQSKDTSQNSSLNTSLNEWLPSTSPAHQPEIPSKHHQVNNIGNNATDNTPEDKKQQSDEDAEEFDAVTSAIIKAYEAKAAQEQSSINSKNLQQEDDASFFDSFNEDIGQKTEVLGANNVVPALPTTAAITQVSTGMVVTSNFQEKQPTQLDKFLTHAAYQASNLDQQNQFNKLLNLNQVQCEGDTDPPTDLFTPTASSRTTTTIPESKELHLDALKGVLGSSISPESHEFFSSIPVPSSTPISLPSQPPATHAHNRDYWKQYYAGENITVQDKLNPLHVQNSSVNQRQGGQQVPQSIPQPYQLQGILPPYAHVQKGSFNQMQSVPQISYSIPNLPYQMQPQSVQLQPDVYQQNAIFNQIQSIPEVPQDVRAQNIQQQSQGMESQSDSQLLYIVPSIQNVLESLNESGVSHEPQSISHAPYLQQLPSKYCSENQHRGPHGLEYITQNATQQQQESSTSFEQVPVSTCNDGDNSSNSFGNIYLAQQKQQLQQSDNFFDTIESQQVQQQDRVGGQNPYQFQSSSVQDNISYNQQQHHGTVDAGAGFQGNQQYLHQGQNVLAVDKNPHQNLDYVSQYLQQRQQWVPDNQFQQMPPGQIAANYIQQSQAQLYQHMAPPQSTGYGAADSHDMYEQQIMPQSPHRSFPPKSIQEAMASNAGRPPINFVAFGFGGKILGISPYPQSFQESKPNASIYTNMYQYVQSQASPGPFRESMDSEYACIQRFVGPLVGQSIQKDRLMKYIQERAQRCQTEEISDVIIQDLSMLWKILGLMVRTGGKFVPTGKKSAQNQTHQNQELINILLSTDQSADMGVNFASPGTDAQTQVDPFKQLPEFQNQEHKNQGAQLFQQQPAMHEYQNSIVQQQFREGGITGEIEQFLIRGQLQEALEYAIKGQIWGVALLLARFCGDEVFKDTAWKMSQSSLPNGTPLHTVCSLLSGQSQQIFREDAINACSRWKQNLAAMAMNRIPGDLEAMAKLGEKLWNERGNICATQTCLVMARKQPQFYSSNQSSTTFVLLGCNHRSNPRSVLSPLAIQRTEIYEYILNQLQPDVPCVAFFPYKIIYAYLLLEYGLISEAAKYCQCLTGMLGKVQGARSGQGVGAGAGGSLQLWWMQVQELQSRISGYVGAHGIQVSHKSPTLFGGLGRLIEKGIDHIVGGSKIAEHTLQQGAGFHRQSSSGQIFDDGSQGRPQSQAKAHPLASQSEASRGRSPTSSSHSFQTPSPQPPTPPQPRTDTTTQSGWISRFLGLTNTSKNSPYSSPQEEVNMYYYNKEMGRWVERGKENEVQEEPVLSPPPSINSIQQSIGGDNTSSTTNNSNVLHTSRDNIDSRYVNTFRPASPGGSQHSNQQTNQFRVPRPYRPNSAPQKQKQSGFLRPGSAGTTEQSVGNQFGYQQFNTQQLDQLYGQIQPIQSVGGGSYGESAQSGLQVQQGQLESFNYQGYQSVYQGTQPTNQSVQPQFDNQVQPQSTVYQRSYPSQEMENLQL